MFKKLPEEECAKIPDEKTHEMGLFLLNFSTMSAFCIADLFVRGILNEVTKQVRFACSILASTLPDATEENDPADLLPMEAGPSFAIMDKEDLDEGSFALKIFIET